MFIFGKSKKGRDSLRKGTVEKVKSHIMAVPRDAEIFSKPDELLSRAQDTDEIKIKSTSLENAQHIIAEYKEKEYSLEIGSTDISFSAEELDYYPLRDDEKTLLLDSKTALYIDMLFSENNMDSYHFQIKMLNMLVPDMVALIDCDAYKTYSGRWAVMTAESSVPPAPSYMYTIHAVYDKDSGNSVWLHTHGLNRCGTIELEILGSTTDNYNDFDGVLDTIAARLIGESKFIDEKEPLTVGVFADNSDIIVTWQRSEWALGDFPKDIQGNAEDRDEMHSLNMGVIYLYASEKDAEKGKLTSILKYNQKLENNPIFYKTTSETQRMRALALERVDYMRKICDSTVEKKVLIKIGLKPDEKYGCDPDMNEYIWFELDELGENSFTATLTQDAYYVDGMVKGVQGEFAYDEIADWRIYTPEICYSPDNVYLFGE